MLSIKFLFFFIPLLSVILIVVNLLLAPHVPYKEKKTPFECGYHSFLLQNRTQFTISFFVFAILFLLFDLEIVLIYPLSVSIEYNGIYGLIFAIIFIAILTVGFVFELGKGALKIESRQNAPDPYHNMELLQAKSINNPFYSSSNTNYTTDTKPKDMCNAISHTDNTIKEIPSIKSIPTNECEVNPIYSESSENLIESKTDTVHTILSEVVTPGSIGNMRETLSLGSRQIEIAKKYLDGIKHTSSEPEAIDAITELKLNSVNTISPHLEFINLLANGFTSHTYIVFTVSVCIFYSRSIIEPLIDPIINNEKAIKDVADMVAKQMEYYIALMMSILEMMLSWLISFGQFLCELFKKLLDLLIKMTNNSRGHTDIKYIYKVKEMISKYNSMKEMNNIEKKYAKDDDTDNKDPSNPLNGQCPDLYSGWTVPGILNAADRGPGNSAPAAAIGNIFRYVNRSLSSLLDRLVSRYGNTPSGATYQRNAILRYSERYNYRTHPMISPNAYRILLVNIWNPRAVDIVFNEIDRLWDRRAEVPISYLMEMMELLIGWIVFNINNNVVEDNPSIIPRPNSPASCLHPEIVRSTIPNVRAGNAPIDINTRDAIFVRMSNLHLLIHRLSRMAELISELIEYRSQFTPDDTVILSEEDWQSVAADIRAIQSSLSTEFYDIFTQLIVHMQNSGFSYEEIDSIISRIQWR